MIRKVAAACIVIFTLGISPAFGADVEEKFSIQDALEIEKVKALFSGDISFYWGESPHPPVVKKYGTYKTSKRTNAFMKDRGDSCGWAMASALVVLQNRAVREGGNAVINIVSNIQNREDSSKTDFTCLAGRVMVNVALKGTVVKLSK